jgi:hypothetical protein
MSCTKSYYLACQVVKTHQEKEEEEKKKKTAEK